MPAAVPSITPWCSCAPSFVRQHEEGAEREQRGLEGDHAGHRVARVPAACGGSVSASSTRPSAVRPTPAHWRVRPAAEEALGEHGEEDEPAGDHRLDERERRQSERADVEAPRAERHAACRPRTTERNSPTALRSGCLSDTSGAAQAPRCLSRKPTLVASAQRSASRIPSCSIKSMRSVVWVWPGGSGGSPPVLRAIGPGASRLNEKPRVIVNYRLPSATTLQNLRNRSRNSDRSCSLTWTA